MASGDLYLADPVKMTAYPCARGETVVYEESGLRLRQFDLVSVNPSLRIAGVVRTPMGGEFYTGGSSYMDYTGSTGSAALTCKFSGSRQSPLEYCLWQLSFGTFTWTF